MRTSNRPDWATIPNLVTLLRFALLAPVCLMLRDGPDTMAVLLLLVWAGTDWVDGLLARLLGQTSRTGEIIDPIADRLGLLAIVLTLTLTGLLPWPALAAVAAADAVMAIGATGAALGGRIRVSWLGKVRTFVLMTAVFLLVAAEAWAPHLTGAARALLWAGVVLHVASAADYVLRARRAPAAPAAEGPPSQR